MFCFTQIHVILELRYNSVVFVCFPHDFKRQVCLYVAIDHFITFSKWTTITIIHGQFLLKSTHGILSRKNSVKVLMEQCIWRLIVPQENSCSFFLFVRNRVAIKRIDDVFRTRTDAKRTLREITILRQCNHPNICKLRYYCFFQINM